MLWDGLQYVIVPFPGHSKKGGKDQESIRSYPLLDTALWLRLTQMQTVLLKKDYILPILSLKFIFLNVLCMLFHFYLGNKSQTHL